MEIKIEKILGAMCGEHNLKVGDIPIGILHRKEGQWKLQWYPHHQYTLDELDQIISEVRKFAKSNIINN